MWSWLKGAAKSVYNFAKDNWNVIKPVVSKIADAAVPALATAVGQPELAVAARGGLKALTGVGVKGSPAMEEKMAKLHSMRTCNMKTGSFILS